MNDWHPYPRSETSTDILKRALELCPQLRPPHRSAGDPEIIDYLVGFRPSRTDGVRLERGPTVDVDGREIKVYYNYGHGGAGWQSCYGTAEDVTGMLLADLI
jgi:D-amino-acid oxidase